MLSKNKYPTVLTRLLFIVIFMSLISGCSEKAKVESVKAEPGTKVPMEQKGYIEKIVVYNKRQASVLEPKDKYFEELSKALLKFLDLSYVTIRWAGQGNNEIVDNTRTGQGVLVIFAKPVELKLTHGVGDPPKNILACKRLYVPLSGSLFEEDKTIVLNSPSEYGWDWGGLSYDEKDKPNQAKSELVNIVSKLPRKNRDEW